MNDLTTHQMVSGIGADHTNKYGKEYLTIGWDAITALVDKPQQVDKAQAQWLIPSSYKVENTLVVITPAVPVSHSEWNFFLDKKYVVKNVLNAKRLLKSYN